MDFIIAYDISTASSDGERRLFEVAKICERYGVRVQKSVFEARLGDMQFERLITDLLTLIDPSLDRVLIYRVHGSINDSRMAFGRQDFHSFGESWIL